MGKQELTFVDLDGDSYIGVKMGDKLIWHGSLDDVESLLGRLGFLIHWKECAELRCLTFDELDDLLVQACIDVPSVV